MGERKVHEAEGVDDNAMEGLFADGGELSHSATHDSMNLIFDGPSHHLSYK